MPAARTQARWWETGRRADAVVIVTDHDDIDYQMIVDYSSLVVDARNAIPATVRCRIDAGTTEMPRPATTRLSVAGRRGASCTIVGAKPASRQAARIAS